MRILQFYRSFDRRRALATIHEVAWNPANGGSLEETCRALEVLAGRMSAGLSQICRTWPLFLARPASSGYHYGYARCPAGRG